MEGGLGTRRWNEPKAEGFVPTALNPSPPSKKGALVVRSEPRRVPMAPLGRGRACRFALQALYGHGEPSLIRSIDTGDSVRTPVLTRKVHLSSDTRKLISNICLNFFQIAPTLYP